MESYQDLEALLRALPAHVLPLNTAIPKSVSTFLICCISVLHMKFSFLELSVLISDGYSIYLPQETKFLPKLAVAAYRTASPFDSKGKTYLWSISFCLLYKERFFKLFTKRNFEINHSHENGYCKEFDHRTDTFKRSLRLGQIGTKMCCKDFRHAV